MGRRERECGKEGEGERERKKEREYSKERVRRERQRRRKRLRVREARNKVREKEDRHSVWWAPAAVVVPVARGLWPALGSQPPPQSPTSA